MQNTKSFQRHNFKYQNDKHSNYQKSLMLKIQHGKNLKFQKHYIYRVAFDISLFDIGTLNHQK